MVDVIFGGAVRDMPLMDRNSAGAGPASRELPNSSSNATPEPSGNSAWHTVTRN